MGAQIHSLLTRVPPRALPVALAHCFAAAKPFGPRSDLLTRIYQTMNPAQKLQCKAELELCRMARRGELKSEVG